MHAISRSNCLGEAGFNLPSPVPRRFASAKTRNHERLGPWFLHPLTGRERLTRINLPRSVSVTAKGQPDQKAPTFQVASIKPNTSTEGRGIRPKPGGRFTAVGIQLRELIRIAYGDQTLPPSLSAASRARFGDTGRLLDQWCVCIPVITLSFWHSRHERDGQADGE